MWNFKSYFNFREENENGAGAGPGGAGKDNEWTKEFIQLKTGFIPPTKLRPIIEAFLKSKEIELLPDTSKAPTMPQKKLFLVGGPVRDFLLGKPIKDFDLATNATPEQVALILHNAGFHMAPDRSGQSEDSKTGEKPQPMRITFAPTPAKQGDKKVWYVKGRDASKERKVFVLGANVAGEDFDIATFRIDAKVTDGQAEVHFTDNPLEDASRRDLTINACYIELSKPDGPNNRLYDPTGKGWHDIKNGVVRAVGKAEERFKEDKLRVMRAIRFHCRFGSSERMDDDIERAIPRFSKMEGVPLERIRDEFLKGLLYPDTDVKKYIKIYKRTGLIETVFPGLEINMEIPAQFASRRDKPLALAWLLQGNPIQKVEAVLGGSRQSGDSEMPTGWASQEKNAVVFLLELLEFSPDDRPRMLKRLQGTGLTPDQIRDWVEFFQMSDARSGKARDRRPIWAKMVRAFADNHQPLAKWEDAQKENMDICPTCRGNQGGCAFCGGTGKLPAHMRGGAVAHLERQRFGQKISKPSSEDESE